MFDLMARDMNCVNAASPVDAEKAARRSHKIHESTCTGIYAAG